MANWTLEYSAVAQDEAQDQAGAPFATGGYGRHYSTWETSTFNDQRNGRRPESARWMHLKTSPCLTADDFDAGFLGFDDDDLELDCDTERRVRRRSSIEIDEELFSPNATTTQAPFEFSERVNSSPTPPPPTHDSSCQLPSSDLNYSGKPTAMGPGRPAGVEVEVEVDHGDGDVYGFGNDAGIWLGDPDSTSPATEPTVSPKPKSRPQPDAGQQVPPRRSNAFRAATSSVSSSASSSLEPDAEQPAPPRRDNAFQTLSSSTSSLEPIGTRQGEWFAERDLGKAPARARSSTSTGDDGGGGDGGGGDSAGQPRQANADERPCTVYLEPVIADVSPRKLAEALDIDVVQLQWTAPVAEVGPPTSPRAGLAMTHSAGPTVTGHPCPRRSRPLEHVDEPDVVVCSPKIGRRQAEAQLAAAGGKPGTFLFRQGSSGGTVLTMSDGDLVHHLVVNDKQGVPVTSFDQRQWMAFVGHYKDAKGALPTTLCRLVLG